MSKTRKKINFIITNEVYPFDVMFSFGQTDEELKAVCKKFNVNIDNTLVNHPLKLGQTISFENGKQLIRLRDYPETPRDYSYLIHEIDHARNNIMDYIGAKPGRDSEECYTYFLDFLTEKALDKIW
jgi:hypothetical protein